MKSSLLSLLMIFFVVMFAYPGSIGGIVKEAGTGNPIPGVKVSALGWQETFTETDGTYALTGLPAGNIHLQAEAEGYHLFSDIIELGEGENLSYNIVLEVILVPQCDTLHFPLAGTPNLFVATSGGYVCGNNSFGDLAKADFFETDAHPKLLNGALFEFGRAISFSGADPDIEFRVWASNGPGGLPGDVIGNIFIPLSIIQHDVDNGMITDVVFDTPVFIDGPFYLGVMLPTLAGDTLALISTDDDDLVPGISYEMWNDHTWYSLDNTSSWGLSIGQGIYASYCDEGFGIDEKINSPEMSVYPNPAIDVLHVNVNTSEAIVIHLINPNGQLAGKWTFDDGTGINLPVDDLRCGIYMLIIIGNDYMLSRKVIISR